MSDIVKAVTEVISEGELQVSQDPITDYLFTSTLLKEEAPEEEEEKNESVELLEELIKIDSSEDETEEEEQSEVKRLLEAQPSVILARKRISLAPPPPPPSPRPQQKDGGSAPQRSWEELPPPPLSHIARPLPLIAQEVVLRPIYNAQEESIRPPHIVQEKEKVIGPSPSIAKEEAAPPPPIAQEETIRPQQPSLFQQREEPNKHFPQPPQQQQEETLTQEVRTPLPTMAKAGENSPRLYLCQRGRGKTGETLRKIFEEHSRNRSAPVRQRSPSPKVRQRRQSNSPSRLTKRSKEHFAQGGLCRRAALTALQRLRETRTRDKDETEEHVAIKDVRVVLDRMKM